MGMTRSVQVETPAARVTLFGFKSVPAYAEVVHRPRSLRFTRAMLALAGCWCSAPVIAILPPHLPWLFVAFAAGLFFAWANWRGSYEVRCVHARCPSCGRELAIRPGARIDLPYRLACLSCHHTPLLEVGGVEG